MGNTLYCLLIRSISPTDSFICYVSLETDFLVTLPYTPAVYYENIYFYFTVPRKTVFDHNLIVL